MDLLESAHAKEIERSIKNEYVRSYLSDVAVFLRVIKINAQGFVENYKEVIVWAVYSWGFLVFFDVLDRKDDYYFFFAFRANNR
ncbi:hypothetical protein [Metapseudomonas otitidis]|uniref:hypothetical protein n=1 Tax=Metapseudomonas otitidis TaxID=319939 RepID=UPI001981730D|nr:hypothetical protein [Pseudomonas otitidis]